jgi:hypothetical protein
LPKHICTSFCSRVSACTGGDSPSIASLIIYSSSARYRGPSRLVSPVSMPARVCGLWWCSWVNDLPLLPFNDLPYESPFSRSLISAPFHSHLMFLSVYVLYCKISLQQ